MTAVTKCGYDYGWFTITGGHAASMRLSSECELVRLHVHAAAAESNTFGL